VLIAHGVHAQPDEGAFRRRFGQAEDQWRAMPPRARPRTRSIHAGRNSASASAGTPARPRAACVRCSCGGRRSHECRTARSRCTGVWAAGCARPALVGKRVPRKCENRDSCKGCVTKKDEGAAHSIQAKSSLLQSRPNTFAQTNSVILIFRLQNGGGPYIPVWRPLGHGRDRPFPLTNRG